MNKALLGVCVGALLGAIDGLSAWSSPDARPMMLAIVAGSTLKGIVTGLLAGLIAGWKRSVAVGIASGVGIGFALSSVAAIGQGGHYFEIVLPGMLVGGLVGFVTQRYPNVPSAAMLSIAVVGCVSGTFVAISAQSSITATDSLAPVARLVGTWTGTSEGQPGKGKWSGSTSAFSDHDSSKSAIAAPTHHKRRTRRAKFMKTSGFSASTRAANGSSSASSTPKASSIST